jgi:cytidine deaminase
MEFEGVPLSFTTHAEQSAVTNAWNNEERGIRQLAISEAPCGYCRQFLWEITTAEKMVILLAKGSSGPLSDLLPQPFGPKDLGVVGGLMSPGDNKLVLDTGAHDQVILAALGAANSSYAPAQYSESYSGAAVDTQSHAIYTGRYAENAAFNPSMSPLESALTMWNFASHGSDPIVRVVLVQVDGARADQTDTTAALVESLSRSGHVIFEVCSAHREPDASGSAATDV